MNSHFHIQYVPYKEIDFVKWDNCIARAPNGLIYGYSYYLDHMAKQWDALVLGDYEAVMPLTWNRKYGISYLYQPFLTPQLGVIGNNVTEEVLKNFLLAVRKKFKYVEINLNRGNDFAGDFDRKRNVSYFISLTNSYQSISAHYNQNLVRNIKKAISAGCEHKKNIPVNNVLALSASQLIQYTRLQKDDIPRFKKLYDFLITKKMASTSGIYYRDELVASCIFFYDNKRIYYILAGNDPRGRKVGASHYLIDQCIRENAGKDMILDFVGSDFSSIALFYKSFGAIPDYYLSLKWNKLPPPVKWLKK